MKEKSVQIRFKQNPVLLDRVLQDLQQSLKSKLPWLNYAFGKAYKLVEHRHDGAKFVYPAAYNGNGEYVSLIPNDNYGNFCWFDIYDPQTIEEKTQSLPQFTFRGALVFWYDLSRIYAEKDFINSEEIKDEIIRVLTSPMLLSSQGRFQITEINERFENIYRGYSIEKVYNKYDYTGEGVQNVDKQFFMYPYGGIRFDFTLTTREQCTRVI